jgi:hypothetical protein
MDILNRNLIKYIELISKKYNIDKEDLLNLWYSNKNIIDSKLQSKEWRIDQNWYKNGKHNECEIYQRNLIEHITTYKCYKTNYRIKMDSLELIEKLYPLKEEDGFEYTENFDGRIDLNNNIYYFNLKFVCDSGGAQTRTLREVYHFIKTQFKILNKYNSNHIYFINILDGNTSFNNMEKFNYLMKEHNKYIYIGDMYNFQIWWKYFK